MVLTSRVSGFGTWNQIAQPEVLEEAEVAARGDQSQFSVWLTGGGCQLKWAKYLGRDLKLRLQLATVATGFGDVMDACMKSLDRVPDNVGTTCTEERPWWVLISHDIITSADVHDDGGDDAQAKMARCYNDVNLQLDLSEGGNGIGWRKKRRKI
ncbi:unnamed protein product [Prunus armeniaca]|uniref:Uncharacterized protein n=1 Tax=Prunus armeniaca TaxID=36596 RepID=A0A6J5TYU1_PRUAR|nr:unnamed protein product [Prunus armeniaca]